MKYRIMKYRIMKYRMKSRSIPFAVLVLLASLAAWAQQPASAALDDKSAASASTETLDLKPGPDGQLSQEQMQQLFRIVADKDIENDKRQHDYTYIDREVQRSLDGKGRVKSTEVKTYEVLEVYGEQVNRLIEKDDKPVDSKEAGKQDEKIQKIIDKRRNESPEERKKREENEAKGREESRQFVKEVADAYNFKLVGTEPVGGREAWIIDAEPRPGYEPKVKDAKLLTKIKGRVWIDKDDLQLSKMDLETIDTVSFGWFIARLHKGAHIVFEQARVNDEVWLPRHVTFKAEARLALLKGYNVEGEQEYRDYKKFRTSAKIVSVGELKEPAGEQK